MLGCVLKFGRECRCWKKAIAVEFGWASEHVTRTGKLSFDDKISFPSSASAWKLLWIVKCLFFRVNISFSCMSEKTKVARNQLSFLSTTCTPDWVKEDQVGVLMSLRFCR